MGFRNEAIDMNGNVYGICRGSGFSFSEDYYTNDLGWLLNDTHGSIVLLAGVEYEGEGGGGGGTFGMKRAAEAEDNMSEKNG